MKKPQKLLMDEQSALIEPMLPIRNGGGMKTAANSTASSADGLWCFNAWLGHFRRLLVVQEHLLSLYYAFYYFACFWIN
jgi:hypothetical protein